MSALTGTRFKLTNDSCECEEGKGCGELESMCSIRG